MGYDISTHPIDVELIQNRLLPYIRGEGDISDLVETAARLAHVQFRANAWGLGLLKLSQAESAARRKKPTANVRRLVPDTFDSDLHVWGRPFFITVPAERVPDVLGRYLAATPKQVDDIAEEMLRELNPELVGQVKPDAGGELPSPKKLAEGIVGALNIFRRAYLHLETGAPVELPGGERTDPHDLFLNSLPLHVVTFAARLRPGWMSRGYVWFTAFIERAKLSAGKLVETAAPLFAPLLAGVKGFSEAFEPTITQNYTVGGYVWPENVPAFRAWMEAHTDRMIAACVKERWDEGGARQELGKVMEALRDAERQKMAFLEAAEVYSGFSGIMN